MIETKTRTELVRLPRSIARRLVLNTLSGAQFGTITLREGGHSEVLEGQRQGPLAEVNIHDPAFYDRVLRGGAMGAAEAYMDGLWSSPDLVNFFRYFCANRAQQTALQSRVSWIRGLLDRAGHWLRRNTREGSRKNIADHYDLGNEFYALFLDETMSYSAAVFESAEVTLAEASVAKIDRLCRKLRLKPGETLLDVGCGWGGFAIHAARNYGVKVTATTVSQAQFDFAKARIESEGLTDCIDLRLEDYRDLEGVFDKVVSVEMIEAVGHEFLPGYFRRLQELVKPDGLVAIQAILLPDFDYTRSRKGVDFIKKYIFPGGQVPSNWAMAVAWSQTTDFALMELEELGDHYAETLRRWRLRFLDRSDEVRAMGFPERFLCMWEYYLAICEAGFSERVLGLSQFVLGRPASPRPLEVPRSLSEVV